MDSGLLVALEMAGVLAVALGWGIYELVMLRRARRRREAAEAAERGRDGS